MIVKTLRTCGLGIALLSLLSACAGTTGSVSKNYSFSPNTSKGLVVLSVTTANSDFHGDVWVRTVVSLQDVARVSEGLNVLELAPGGYEFYKARVSGKNGKQDIILDPSRKFIVDAGKATYVGTLHFDSPSDNTYRMSIFDQSREELRLFRIQYPKIRYSQIQVGVAH